MKKIIAILAVVCIMLSFGAFSVAAAEYVWVAQPKYDYIGLPGSTKAPYFTFRTGDVGGYLDGNGYEMISGIHADMTSAAFYRYTDGNCYALLSENNEMALLKPDGARITGEEALAFLMQYSIEPEEEMIEQIYKKSEGSFGAMQTISYQDGNGQNLFEPISAWNAGNFHGGVAVVETEKNVYALLDVNGNTMPQDVKLNLTGFYYEDLCIAEKDGKYGLIRLSTPRNISVKLNWGKIYFDQLPVIDNDRTLVPVRAIFEALGAEVSWDGETRTVTAVKDGKVVSLTIDDVNATVDGVVEVLDVPAKIIGDRTMVPVRFIAQSFGAEVTWDGSTKTVMIISR